MRVTGVKLYKYLNIFICIIYNIRVYYKKDGGNEIRY